MDAPIIEERVRIDNAGLTLSGVLAYPESATPGCAVLLCAPHPNFAGNMDNNVIQALAPHLSSAAIVLRFNYRGVGESEIRLPVGQSVFDYWSDTEETQNYADALSDVESAARMLEQAAGDLPLFVVGYSFGAIVGLKFGSQHSTTRGMVGIAPPLTRYAFDFLADCRLPCLLVSGLDDFVFSAETTASLLAKCGPNICQERLTGKDHFFRGDEPWACERVEKFVSDVLENRP